MKEVRFEPLSFESLPKKFQDLISRRLMDAQGIIAEEYESHRDLSEEGGAKRQAKDNIVTVSVSFEFSIAASLETGAVEISGSGAVKAPKFKKAKVGALLQRGVVIVERDDENTRLPLQRQRHTEEV